MVQTNGQQPALTHGNAPGVKSFNNFRETNMKRRSLLRLLLAPLAILVPNSAMAQGSYCDGHRDGHKAYYDAKGGGYPGYPGCPGDPGSPGGSATPYQRGVKDGMFQAAREDTRR